MQTFSGKVCLKLPQVCCFVLSLFRVRSCPERANSRASANAALLTMARSAATESFSEVVGKILFDDSGEFALHLLARIDELYLNEQELLFDSEVCEVCRPTASEILGGKDLTPAIARGKVAAWKVEGDEVENLLVRCEARECGQVPIGQHQRNLRRRRERATSKLFVMV